MTKNFFSLSLLLVIVLTACAQSKKTSSKSASKTAPKTEYVSMERTACFGKCPSYIVEVYKNGLVRYTSRHFTEYEGIYEKNVGTEKTAAVLKKFDEYRVDTCKDEYPQMIADLPGIIYHINYADKKEKSIYQAHFGPSFLKDLADKIDGISKVDDGWKKVEDKQRQ